MLTRGQAIEQTGGYRVRCPHCDSPRWVVDGIRERCEPSCSRYDDCESCPDCDGYTSAPLELIPELRDQWCECEAGEQRVGVILSNRLDHTDLTAALAGVLLQAGVTITEDTTARDIWRAIHEIRAVVRGRRS